MTERHKGASRYRWRPSQVGWRPLLLVTRSYYSYLIGKAFSFVQLERRAATVETALFLGVETV